MELLNQLGSDTTSPISSSDSQSSNHNLSGIPTSVQEIESWLAIKLAEKLELGSADAIDRQMDFVEYGLSSMEAVNLSGELENYIGRRLPPTLLWDYPNIESLALYLWEELENIADVTNIADHPELNAELNPQLHNPTHHKIHPENVLNNGEIPAEYYRFELNPKYLHLKEQQTQIASLGIDNPFFVAQERVNTNTTVINGRELSNYATYNYLGMAGDPQVSKAAKKAIDVYGTSALASRLLSGEKPIHRQLERAIADLLGTEDSIVFVGGHATNVTTISHLFGQNDLILHDQLSHNSIFYGCILSGATVMSFPHNNWQALEQMLEDARHRYKRVLIAIEGVYSTDGDIANLPEFINLKHKYKTFLMVDEAHSIGTLGKTGRGVGEYFNVNPADVDLWMGTLSKSFASCGGYIAGSQAIVEYLKYTAPGFVYSVGISPPDTAAALAAIQVLREQPERVSRLQSLSQYFLSLAQEKGLNTGLSSGSPVIPIIVGDSMRAVQLSHNLGKRGINVPFMFYPSVPHNEARLRFFVTCLHEEEQIRQTIDILVEEINKMD
jgi:8-amino-7-oxononanoate synthase